MWSTSLNCFLVRLVTRFKCIHRSSNSSLRVECNAPEVLRELTNDYEYFAAQGNLVRKPAQTRSITAFCRAPGDGGFKGSTFKLLEAREFGQNVLYVRIRLTSSRFKAPGYIDYSVSYMLRKVRYGRCHRRPCFKIRGEVQSKFIFHSERFWITNHASSGMSNPRLASMFK